MRLRAAILSMVVGLAGVWSTACHGEGLKVLEPGQVALEFDMRSWQHEHGLPAGDRVHAILQTRDGYLWVGTPYGLARFDGRSFTVFDHVSTPELADDDCRSLAEDLEGNLWIGTKRSLLRKFGSRFTPFTDQLGKQFMAYPPMCASRDGGVWVGGPGSVCRVQGETVTIHTADQGIPIHHGVTCLEEDQTGSVWMGTMAGLVRFDVKQKRFEAVGMEAGLEHPPIFGIWRAPRGELWVFFVEFVPESGRPAPNAWISCIDPGQLSNRRMTPKRWVGSGWQGPFLVGDQQGTLWLPGRPGGFRRYRNEQLEVLPLLSRKTDDYSLSAFPDREGNLWVGTDKSGLQRWTPRKFVNYTARTGLAHDNVWSICETADGSVLVGTDGGVTQFKDGQSRPLKRADGSAHNNVRAVVEDAEGAIWIGTMRSLERVRDGVAEQVELPGEWFETKVRALQPARDGSMWVGTVRGLTRLHKEERTKYTRAEGLGSDEVRAILEDRSGDLWVGTLGGGLSRLHDGRFKTLTTTNGLSSNNVWALHEDSDGVIWFGTDNGLGFFKDGKVSAFTKADGLPDTLVNLIVSDDLGRLWIGHDRRIYTLEREQLLKGTRGQQAVLRVVSYDESDGLPSIETNGQKSCPAACKTRGGQLWFPTTQGVAVVDPAKIPRQPVPPIAVIQEVRANGRQVIGDHPQAPAGRDPTWWLPTIRPDLDLHLPPGSARVLEFHYTANTFIAPEKARFKYRLVGLDDHWIDAGSQRQAYFTDLRPGEYRFELIACNHHGLWQEQGATLAFHLLPFYYQTWWFNGACAGLGTLLVGFAVAWRVRELRRIYRLERVNALEEQRRRIARDIHDELGSSLTHIMQLSERVRGAAGRSDTPNPRAERIATLAGEAVDNIGEIVWANNPEYDTLEDLVAYLREHAASFFADTSIQAHFDFPENVPSRRVTGSFRRHLVLLLKEALQNVSKHAEAREVSVCLALRGGQIELSVADDGVGLPPGGARRFGNGLTNMKQRATELEGTFEITSQPGAGTRIQVVIPIHHF